MVTLGAAGATATSVTLDTNYHIHVIKFDGSQTGNSNRLVHRMDGTQRTLTFTGTVGATSNATTTFYYLGTDTSNNNDFDGYLSEVIIYTKALNSGEMSNLESYLKNKWGIA